VKPKPFSIQHRFLLVQAITLLLALWFLASAIYVSLKIDRDLEVPLQDLHAGLELNTNVDAALDKFWLAMWKAYVNPSEERTQEFETASQELSALTAQQSTTSLLQEDQRGVWALRQLQEQLVQNASQLQLTMKRTPEAAARIREVVRLHTQIESSLNNIANHQFQRLESSTARLQQYTRLLYLLVLAFGLTAILSLVLFRRSSRQDLWQPLERLRQMALAIQQGNLDIQAKVPASVEMAPLVRTFLHMAAELRKMRNSLAQKVLDRAAKLEAAQKQLLQAEKLSSLGQLVSGVAHEINNPLTSILGFTDVLLARPDLDPKTNAHLQTIHNESLRLKTLVTNLTNFARRGVQRVACLDLRQVLDRIVDLRNYQLAANNIRLHYDRPAEPVYAEGDADQLLQVFFNLVLNAEQAIQASSKPGDITLSCGVQDGKAWVAVRDNGTGMAPDVAERIFEPFFTTKPVGQGSGLGLSVCHGIVEQHRGEITVESAEGQGTTMRVFLRAAQLAHPASTESTEKSDDETTTPLGPAPRALIIDDEPTVSALVEEALKQHGWGSKSVSDSTEVEAALAAEDFDLVICDLKMPGRNGLEILRLLRQEWPKLAGRFLLMTGDLSEGVQNDPEFDSVPVLQKPFPLARLIEAVRQLIQKKG